MSRSTASTTKPVASGAARAPASTPPEKALHAVAATDYLEVFQAGAMERIRLVKRGVPASALDAMARSMAVSKEKLVGTLGLPRATVDRKSRENRALSPDESSRVLGMSRLVGQVQAMVQESGNPEGLDAATWVARWLERPLPALEGQRPAELMDTPEGQALVSDIVARMQSAAYA